MKTIGIIAELNPPHNGHAYLIDRAKKELNADYCVLILSGNFTQRGIPAVIDKYARTRMALSMGADLVIEMPVFGATAAAPDFAAAGVNLLNKLGIVDYVVFGSECGDIDMLTKLAGIKETDEMKARLQSGLRSGLNYPAAYAQALELTKEEAEAFENPNNLLAIEYIKAILNLKKSGQLLCPLIPYTVKRVGEGYHSTEVNAPFASASALRSIITEEAVKSQMPKEAYFTLEEYLHNFGPLYEDHFTTYLNYELNMGSNDFCSITDVDIAISNKLKKLLPNNLTFKETIEALKTKEITYAHIERALLHILLRLRKEDIASFKVLGSAPYAHILGFRKENSSLLKEIKKSGNIPLLNKLADAYTLLNEEAYALLRKDMAVTDFYSYVLEETYKKPMPKEITHGIIQYP